MRSIRTRARKPGAAYRIRREQLGNSPECETLIERGELFDHVLRVVQENHIDVVALSAHTHPVSICT
jgi:hypothetical protein